MLSTRSVVSHRIHCSRRVSNRTSGHRTAGNLYRRTAPFRSTRMTFSISLRAPRYVEHRSYTPSRTHRPLSTSTQPSEQTKYGHQSKKYRLLVTRGVTQRLHSPSLEALLSSDDAEDEEEGWIREDRQFSKARVVEELRYLGVPWSMYPSTVVFIQKEGCFVVVFG